MLLACKLKIYTDHKHLTNLIEVSESPQMQRLQLTIVEFGPDLGYIYRFRNVIADALSRFDSGMSHATYNSDASPELFTNSDDKSLRIDYPLNIAVLSPKT